MTRVLVQRTSGGSSSNPSQNRSSSTAPLPPPPPPPPLPPPSLQPSLPLPSQACGEEEEESVRNLNEAEICQDGLETSGEDGKSREMDDSVKDLSASETGSAEESNVVGSDEWLASGLNSIHLPPDERSRNVSSSNLGGFEHGQAGLDLCGTSTNSSNDRTITNSGFKREISAVELGVFDTFGKSRVEEDNAQFSSSGSSQMLAGCSCPPPPPVPPPKPTTNSSSRRIVTGGSSTLRSGTSRWSSWAIMASRTSPSGSRPSSPRSHGEGEGYNSADEQSPCFGSSYDDAERERLFEMDIRRSKGFEVRRMAADGNCLFRAVADQVYGDAEMYDVTRQMCIDYLEKERDHFSQFVTESFTAYCKRKRRDKVYGNNMEIQAMSEMYNRPIHIYSYSTEPINIFHGSYKTDSPPIRLSYHRGNHYNSLVDPHRLTIGAGLGFSSLQGTNIDKDQVKAAIKAQQDQQIENALLAEGRLYSDLELTEKEIERMVMEASRAEYLAEDKYRQQFGYKESSTSAGAEPSSSGATTGSSGTEFKYQFSFKAVPDSLLTSSMQTLLSMGFSHLRVVEAYSIFGDDVDSMVCYLLETGTGSPGRENMHRMKGKAAEK